MGCFGCRSSKDCHWRCWQGCSHPRVLLRCASQKANWYGCWLEPSVPLWLLQKAMQLAPVVGAICALLIFTVNEPFLPMLSRLPILVYVILGLSVFSLHWGLLCLCASQAASTRELTLVSSLKQPSTSDWWNWEDKGSMPLVRDKTEVCVLHWFTYYLT